jgi:uncharacterized surface protein with fasciclin (FAS1) repeats/uncharacterized protein YegP (UPF0339 family)
MADIVDIAVATNSFKTLVTAVKAAGLVDTLKGAGPFTVFAPDDEAFAKLPQGTVEELLKDIPKLKAILMYHVVAGKLTVDEISHMQTIKTVQGQEVRIDAHHWWNYHMNPKINDAYITSKDVVTDNGIIHVLSRVLMPNMELTCPVCGMGFMTMEAMKLHTTTAHTPEKVPEPAPVIEKAPEPPMPVIEKVLEPLPPVEVIKGTEAETAKVVGVFEVMYDAAGKFRFHLKAGNGQIIAVSQSYGAKESAIKGIDSIKKNAPIAKIADLTKVEGTMPMHVAGIVQDPVFEIQFNAPDRFRFHLKAVNGEIIAVSQSYLSKQAAETGIASVKTNAPMAKIIDHTVPEA